MKRILILIGISISLFAYGDTKISQLPLGTASTTGSLDSFPYVDAADVETKRLRLSDLINIPTLSAPTFCTSKVLTGYSSATGTISAADSILTAIEKLNGNMSSLGSTVSIGTIDGNGSSINGLSFSAPNLYAQSASASVPGMVNNTSQTFSGAKTFSSTIVGATNGNPPNARNINTTAPITGGGDLSADRTIAMPVGTSLANGYLSSTDWSTFNGKQSAGNYITALTGDVTASGPGSVVSTIATGAVTDTKASLANKPAVTVVATSNQTLSGTPTVDGQATAAGSIILLTAQSTGAENGPWVAAAGAWSRPTWYPSAGTTQAFQFITTLVRLGTTYQGSVWRMTTSGAITIDTTATTWVVTPHALNSSTITGIVPVANGGTGAITETQHGVLLGQGTSAITATSVGATNTVLHGSTGADPSFSALVGADLPNPSSSTLGGIRSIAAVAHQWINTISTSGIPALTQPAFTDISGSLARTQIAVGTANQVITNTAGGDMTSGVSPGTSGNVLTSSAGAWVSSAPATSGTVTSVAQTVPVEFSIGGSPITSSGTLAITKATETANTVWAGATSGGAAQPTFRSLVGADLPNPSSSTLGGIQSIASQAHKWINTISTSGVPALTQPAFSDISNYLDQSQMPQPLGSSLGGILAFAPISHNFLTGVGNTGLISSAQPAFSDISGSLGRTQIAVGTANQVIVNTAGGDMTGGVSPGTSGNVLTSSGGAWVSAAATGGSGTVTSVAQTVPAEFSIGGSPVTTSGTLAITKATQSANTLWAGPQSGSAAQPAFRSLVNADIPQPTASSLGGIISSVATTNNFVTGVDTTGTITKAQPAFTNISGTATVGQGGTGTGTTFTQGSVVFAGSSGVYAQDNGNIFYDSTGKSLIVGAATTTSSAALRATKSFTGVAATTFGVAINPTFSETSSANSNFIAGATVQPIIAASNTQNWTGSSSNSFTALFARPNFTAGATGTVSNSTDILAQVLNPSAMNITNRRSVFARDPSNTGGGTITSQAGFVVEGLSAATNNTGVLVGASAIPSGNWGIYNNSSNPNYSAGSLGIGVTDTFAQQTISAIDSIVNDSEQLELRSNREAITNGELIGGISFRSNDTNLTQPGTKVAYLDAIATATHTASALDTALAFTTTQTLATAEKMRITSGGSLGLGTSSPTAWFEQHANSGINYHQFTNDATTSGVNKGTLIGIDASGNADFNQQANASLGIYTNAVKRISIANSGALSLKMLTNGVVLTDVNGLASNVAPSTSGNVLTSNGTTWTSATPAAGGTGMSYIGSVTYAAISTCRWTLTSSTMGNFAAVAGCNSATASNNVSAPGTKIPAVTLTINSTTDYYKFEAVGKFQLVDSGQVYQCRYRFSDGTSNSESESIAAYNSTLNTNINTIAVPVITGLIKFGSTGSKTVNIQAESSDNSHTCSVNADDSYNNSTPLTINVYRVPVGTP